MFILKRDNNATTYHVKGKLRKITNDQIYIHGNFHIYWLTGVEILTIS